MARGEAEDLENIDGPGARAEADPQGQEAALGGNPLHRAAVPGANGDARHGSAMIVVVVGQRLAVGALEIEARWMQPGPAQRRVIEVEAIVDHRDHDLGIAGRDLPGFRHLHVGAGHDVRVAHQVGRQVPLLGEQHGMVELHLDDQLGAAGGDLLALGQLVRHLHRIAPGPGRHPEHVGATHLRDVVELEFLHDRAQRLRIVAVQLENDMIVDHDLLAGTLDLVDVVGDLLPAHVGHGGVARAGARGMGAGHVAREPLGAFEAPGGERLRVGLDREVGRVLLQVQPLTAKDEVAAVIFFPRRHPTSSVSSPPRAPIRTARFCTKAPELSVTFPTFLSPWPIPLADPIGRSTGEERDQDFDRADSRTKPRAEQEQT